MSKTIGVSVTTAVNNGAILVYNGLESIQAHLYNNLERLNNAYKGNTMELYFGKNDKLQLPDISMPSEVLRTQFMVTVYKNPSLLELESVKILHEFFKNQKMCVNCEGCFNSCYVTQAYIQYKDTNISHLRNLLIFITNKAKFIEDIKDYTTIYNVFRFNTSGDIFNAEYMEAIIEIANNNEDCKYYLYTKNFELVEKYLQADLIPANLNLNLSLYGQFHIEKIMEMYKEYKVNIYNVVAENTEVEENLCKSWDNVPCSKCKMCSKKNHTIITNYIHGGRKSKAKI